MDNTKVRGSLSSLAVPRVKPSYPNMDIPKATSDVYSDVFHFTSGASKEHPKLCDICRRSESLLNPILVCSSCKVCPILNCKSSRRSIPLLHL